MNWIKSLLVLGVALVALAGPLDAQAQFSSSDYKVGTFDVPAEITGGGTSNVLSSIVLEGNRGVTILPYFAGTNSATTGNLELVWRVSVDNASWSDPVLTNTFVAKGQTATRPYAVIPSSVLSNVKFLQLYQISSSNDPTNTVFITNITYSISRTP